MESSKQLIVHKERRPVKLSELGVRQVIDRGTVLNGNLDCASSILVRGVINGNVAVSCTGGLVIIHPDGCVNGNIKADFVYIAGCVTGDVACNGLRVMASGTLRGKFSCQQLGVDPGAKLHLDQSACDQPVAAETHDTTAINA